SMTTYGTYLLRLSLADGRAVYFARPDTSSPYVSQGQLGFYGQAVKNADNSYTITFKDGRIHQFNPAGKLLSITNRNGNTISITLDTTGKPIAITDASGRVITITYDGENRIGTLSDTMGTIATYTHSFWGRLTRVTYADGSQFNYADAFIGSYILVTSVTDA